MPCGFFRLRSLRNSLAVKSEGADVDAVMSWEMYEEERLALSGSSLSQQCNVSMPQRGCRIIPRLSSPGLTLPLNLLMWSGHSCPLAFDFALDLNETNNETKLFAGTNAPPHPRGDRLTAIVPEVPRAVTWGPAAARGRCTRPSVGEASRTPRRGR